MDYLQGRRPAPDWNSSRVHAYGHLLAAEKVYEIHGDTCCVAAVETLADELSAAELRLATDQAVAFLGRPKCCFR